MSEDMNNIPASAGEGGQSLPGAQENSAAFHSSAREGGDGGLSYPDPRFLGATIDHSAGNGGETGQGRPEAPVNGAGLNSSSDKEVQGAVIAPPTKDGAPPEKPSAPTGGDAGHRPGDNLGSIAGIHKSGGNASGLDPGRHDTLSRCVETVSIPRKRRTRATVDPSTKSVAPSSNTDPAQAGGLDLSTTETRTSNVETEHLPPQPRGEWNDPILAEIRMLWRRRVQWHTAEKRLTLQSAAICRGASDGDKVAAGKMLARIEAGKTSPDDLVAEISVGPLLAARDAIREQRGAVEKTLAKLARKTEIYPWAKAVYGFGDIGLAGLLGEAGDFTAWRSPAALWKRFGLAVIDGERQRRIGGIDAMAHGYSPKRRSLVWNIGGGLIGGMGRGPRPMLGEDISARDDLSPYQKLFVERLRYEAARDPKHRKPDVATPAGPRESFSLIAAARAKRYVEKRMIRDMWAAWRELRRAADPAWLSPGDLADIEMRRAARLAAAERREANRVAPPLGQLPPATDSAPADAGGQRPILSQTSSAAGTLIAAE